MSSLPRVVILRHGERADKYPETEAQQEINNASMTQAGFVQALGAGKMLRNESAVSNSRRKWKVIVSPFLRALQTATAVVAVLGKELCENYDALEVDFMIGEEFKWLEMPPGVLSLTPESASQIVKESFDLSMSLLASQYSDKNESQVVDVVSTNNNGNTTFTPPRVRFGYGSADKMKTGETLPESGVRLYSAVQRLYRHHILSPTSAVDERNRNLDELPNLLLVSHGFAPVQLLKLMYGDHQIETRKVYLCSTTGLKLSPLSPHHQDKNALPHFEFDSTRGVDYVLPTTNVETENEDVPHDNDNNSDKEEDLFHYFEKTYYESKTSNKNEKEFFLGFSGEPKAFPSGLIPKFAKI